MIRKIIGVCSSDIEKLKLKVLLTNKYRLKQHKNCPEIYTNKEKTVQLEEQEKALLVRFK